MFRALWRWVKALGYLVTGKVDKARMTLMMNPNVMQANYDEITRTKVGRLTTMKDAVSGLVAQQEQKVASLKTLTAEVQEHERLKAGAAAKAKEVVKKHGGDTEAVKKDPDYARCQAAFRDFSSTLEEKLKRVQETESDVERLGATIQTHKNTMQSLRREIEALKAEKHEAVAEVLSAKQEQEIADMISGISEDTTSQELLELREVRTKARANARISREVAGVTAQQEKDEFLNYANNNVADNEFDKMIGLSVPWDKTGLPAPDAKMIEMQPESVTIKPATEKVKETL